MNNATLAAIRVRDLVFSSRGCVWLDRFPSGQMVFLLLIKRQQKPSSFFIRILILRFFYFFLERSSPIWNRSDKRVLSHTYKIILSKFSIFSTSITVLAACVIRLLAAWLTHGAPDQNQIGKKKKEKEKKNNVNANMQICDNEIDCFVMLLCLLFASSSLFAFSVSRNVWIFVWKKLRSQT